MLNLFFFWSVCKLLSVSLFILITYMLLKSSQRRLGPDSVGYVGLQPTSNIEKFFTIYLNAIIWVLLIILITLLIIAVFTDASTDVFCLLGCCFSLVIMLISTKSFYTVEIKNNVKYLDFPLMVNTPTYWKKLEPVKYLIIAGISKCLFLLLNIFLPFILSLISSLLFLIIVNLLYYKFINVNLRLLVMCMLIILISYILIYNIIWSYLVENVEIITSNLLSRDLDKFERFYSLDLNNSKNNVSAGLFLLATNKFRSTHFKAFSLFYIVYSFYIILFLLLCFDQFKSYFKTYFITRIPVSILNTSYEHYLVSYNIVVILFSSFIMIYFLLSFIYVIVYFKNNKDLSSFILGSNNSNRLELLLYNFIKYNLILIFIFAAIFHFYFNLSTDFAINSTHLYNLLYHEKVSICYYIGNQFSDVYVYNILYFSKSIFGYLWAGFVTKYSNLTLIKINRNSNRTIEFINKDNWIIRIAIIYLIFAYINYICKSISYNILIEPYELSKYVFTLVEIVIGNNVCHSYLLISTFIIIITFNGIKYLSNITILDNFKVMGFTKYEWILFMRAILMVTFSLAYFTLLISTLWMFVHYIPAGFIGIKLDL